MILKRDLNVSFAIKNLALFCATAYILNFHTFIKNLGLSLVGFELNYLVEIFLVFPMAFILIRAINIREIRFPKLLIFILATTLFLALEAGAVQTRELPDYTYPYHLLIFYCLYLFLANYGSGSSDVENVIDLTLVTIYVYLGCLYLIYLGFLTIQVDASNISIDSFNSTRISTGDLLQQNGASLVATIAIYLLIYQREQQENKGSFLIMLLKVVFLCGIILIHASRGALLVATPGIAYFFINTLRTQLKVSRGVAVTLVFVVLSPILLVWFGNILDSVLLFQRFTDESQNTSRMRQVYVTWVNFRENPWFGVGYYNAARGVLAGYGRSNFHYTQILASNGIFYFFVFLIFIFKVFFSNIKAKGVVVLFGPAAVIGLMFYNWSILWPMAILAYIVYFENKKLKEQELELIDNPESTGL